ncbi:NUDIX domain-containing protein [Clostridium sp. MD294]|uniref:NUDIX domain-containing protein n=1 Tax=Clostridium sp. MD294 TaxID=97138 RepID=UPI0002CBA0EE|nr:NUDIX domain-containing protein [Clostridium sp. MD294]NDO47683.1 NUDIX domain-containing protein [Clostridium sp. MD294]USF30000.1 hypothetical protein C820_001423 [Clostridium sp. MD294]
MKRDFVVAVKAIIVRENKVLVLRRSEEEVKRSYVDRKEKWDLPGGGIHYFERSEEGLLREIKEETSLSVKIKKPFKLFDIIKPHIHLCIFTYVCDYEYGEVVLSAEHDSYFWLTLKQVQQWDLPKWLKRDFVNVLTEIERK